MKQFITKNKIGIIIISIMLIIANSLGIFVFYFLGFLKTFKNSSSIILNNYVIICSTFITIGIALLIIIFLSKNK